VWPGTVRSGGAGWGKVWQAEGLGNRTHSLKHHWKASNPSGGMDRVWRGEARSGMMGRGRLGCGLVWQGPAWRGPVGQDLVRRDWVGCGRVRFGKMRSGMAR
jgi:hypothetical protein